MKFFKYLSIILTICSIALFAACSKTAYNSGWQIAPVTFEEGTTCESFVQLTLQAEKKYEVWVNLTMLGDSDIAVGFSAGYDEDTVRYSKATVTLTAQQLKQTGGWVRVQKELSTSYDYIDVGSKYAVKINEIVACDEDGKVYELKFSSAGYRISRDSSANVKKYTEEELNDLTSDPRNVCDEQTAEFNRADLLGSYEQAFSVSSK